MNIAFEGRTVLITGAAHGLGRAMCRAFSELGASVWACDVLEAELAETVDACGGAAKGQNVDVTDRESVQAWIGEVLEADGRIDALVNNAGGVAGQVGRPAEEVASEQWRAIVDVNLSGTFYCAQAVIPSMKAAGYGRIVNISSGAGLGVSLTGIQAYASAKAGQIGLTRQLAHELGPFGVTVNCVAPGFVLSNPSTEAQWESYGPEGQKRLVDNIALGRLGEPEDIAHAVLFLASDYAGWITGQTLRVDGGK